MGWHLVLIYGRGVLCVGCVFSGAVCCFWLLLPMCLYTLRFEYFSLSSFASFRVSSASLVSQKRAHSNDDICACAFASFLAFLENLFGILVRFSLKI